MTRLWIVLLVMAALAFPITAQKTSREEGEVRAAIDRWAAAVGGRDQKALEDLFADDLFITDISGSTRGKKEGLSVLMPVAGMTTTVVNEDLRIRLIGKKNAVVTGRVKMAFESNEKQSSIAMRYTSVWEKRKGAWQLIVLQSSRAAK